jgi:hypothetical protein
MHKKDQHTHLRKMPSQQGMSSFKHIVQVREEDRRYGHCSNDVQIAAVGVKGRKRPIKCGVALAKQQVPQHPRSSVGAAGRGISRHRGRATCGSMN